MSTLDESQRKTFTTLVTDRSNPLAGPVRNTVGN
jgi:hypothetical protein